MNSNGSMEPGVLREVLFGTFLRMLRLPLKPLKEPAAKPSTASLVTSFVGIDGDPKHRPRKQPRSRRSRQDLFR